MSKRNVTRRRGNSK